jgi:hypothetical protein
MIDHPLFVDDESSDEKRSRDIGYINIYQFENGRRVALTDQWDPDQLQTVADIYNAVGAGHFELVGRHAKSHKIVDRAIHIVKAPRGAETGPTTSRVEQQSQQSQQSQPQPMAPPTMQIGGMQIPPGTDPQTAMILAMMHTTSAQNALQLQAMREDARFHGEQLTQLMLGFTQANGQMVTGLAQAFSGRANGQGTDGGAAEGFIKGVETMANLAAGMREGGGDEPKPTAWGDVTKNIAESLRAMSELAKVTATGGAPPPVVPPGEPVG